MMQTYDKELVEGLYKRIEELEAAFLLLQEFVDRQAEDAGLWCEAEYASEAYIQRGLRGCHAMIEQTIAALDKEQNEDI